MGGEHIFHSSLRLSHHGMMSLVSQNKRMPTKKTKFKSHDFLVRALNSTIHHSLSPNLFKKFSLTLSETENFSKSKIYQ